MQFLKKIWNWAMTAFIWCVEHPEIVKIMINEILKYLGGAQ